MHALSIRRIFMGMGMLMALTALLWGAGQTNVSAETLPLNYARDQIVVKAATAVSINEINAAYNTTTLKQLSNSAIYLLQAPDGTDARQLAAAMNADGRVLYAEPNYPGAAPEASGVDIYGWGVDIYGWGVDIYGWGVDIYGWPDDSIASDAAHINPRDLFGWEFDGFNAAHYFEQPAVHLIKLPQAQTYSAGDGIVVAVLDTGVDAAHPVLADSLTAVRYDFIDDDPIPEDNFNGLDDDNDGFVDEIAGHGTHIAGIIHLVAPQAQIMPLRVLDSDGQGDSFVVAEALLFAAEHGADVINLSLGTAAPSVFLEDVLSQIAAQGILVVAAAGNLNADIPQYPAASACALGVTATGPGVIKSDYASYGSWVNIAAPGERIYSAYPGGGFAWWQGTSMATPFVAGQAALLRSAAPHLTIHEVAQLITGTARSLDEPNQVYEGLMGAGLIEIQDSLNALNAGTWAASDYALSACENAN